MSAGPKILIIDDDPDIVESMSILLRTKGYGIVAARDYDEGLAKVKEVKPDLIILDAMLLLHQKSGFELSQEVRKDPDTRRIPILMISAINETSGGFSFSPSPGDENVPVDGFINKPARPEELFSKVEQLLKSAASR